MLSLWCFYWDPWPVAVTFPPFRAACVEPDVELFEVGAVDRAFRVAAVAEVSAVEPRDRNFRVATAGETYAAEFID